MSVFLAAAAASCTIADTQLTVTVPPIAAPAPASEPKIPGRYAVVLRAGGWMLSSKSENGECGHYLFAVNPSAVFEDGLKASLTTYLEAVDFIKPTPENPKISLAGYDGVIRVIEKSSRGSWMYKDSRSVATYVMTLHIALLRGGKEIYQQDFEGRGSDNGGYFVCSEAAAFHGNAMQRALVDLIGQTDRTLHQRLAP